MMTASRIENAKAPINTKFWRNEEAAGLAGIRSGIGLPIVSNPASNNTIAARAANQSGMLRARSRPEMAVTESIKELSRNA